MMGNPEHSDVVLRTFERLADRWQLTTAERSQWLGVDLGPEERLDRLSYALGIYQALHRIFSDSGTADGWIRRQNSHFGCSALSYALAGGTQAMREVRQYLDGQVLS